MKLFDGKCAWFASNVPATHISAWLNDGGVQIRDASKPIVQYFFSNTLDDSTTADLVRNQDKVLYRSTWVMDSAASRTRQPLGAYALSGALVQQGPESVRRPAFQSPAVNRRRRPLSTTVDASYSADSGLVYGRPAAPTSVPRRPLSMAGGEYQHRHISPLQHHQLSSFQDHHAQYRDTPGSETQSMVSRSSRHSNASSILSNYGRRQPVSRFAIHADDQTIASILADVADFTPNSHGFVAYKIPKLA
ncbi:hypothetical protein EV175_005720 [Coemansia sp. RSA 1933]|nr:hypothetical protein EV175_005720 [Coemansia sp. RSA 1933]